MTKVIMTFMALVCLSLSTLGQTWDVTDDYTIGSTTYPGAVPDDTGDDTDAILYWLDQIPTSTGGTLLFPAGEYLVSGNTEFYIRISDYQSLTLAGSTSGETIITFDHRVPSNPNDYYNDKGIYVERCPDFTIQDMHLTSKEKNLNPAFRDNMANGLTIREGSPRAKIENVEFSYFTENALLIRPTKYSRSDDAEVLDCEFHHNGSREANGSTGSRAFLLSAQVDSGVRSQYVSGATVTGCRFWDNGSEDNSYSMAFYAGYVKDLLFYDNHVSGPDLCAGSNYLATGFSIFPDGEGVEIYDNHFENAQISIHSAVEIYNNHFYNCRNFRIVGSGTQVTDNTFVLQGDVPTLAYIVHVDDYLTSPENGTAITFDNNMFIGLGLTGLEAAIRSIEGEKLEITNNQFRGIPYPLYFKSNDSGNHVISGNVFEKYHRNQGTGVFINPNIPGHTPPAPDPYLPITITNNTFLGEWNPFEDFTTGADASVYSGNTHNGVTVP